MNHLIIQADQGKQRINKNVYGHFAEHLGRCIYEGIWVGEDSPIPNTRGIRNDVIEALCKIHVPVLRWPGGCFADEYHWQDGLGPRTERRSTVNTNWGGLVEDNQFGTHEFFDLCAMIGADPHREAQVHCELRGVQASEATDTILTAQEMGAHNTFQDPERVKPTAFTEIQFNREKVTTVLPPMSVCTGKCPTR